MKRGKIPGFRRLRDSGRTLGEKATSLALAPMIVLSLLPIQALPNYVDKIDPAEGAAVSEVADAIVDLEGAVSDDGVTTDSAATITDEPIAVAPPIAALPDTLTALTAEEPDTPDAPAAPAAPEALPTDSPNAPDGPLLPAALEDSYTVTYDPGEHGLFNVAVFTELELGSATPIFPYNYNNCDPGWRFTGWDPEPTATVTETVTYTAQWLPDSDLSYTIHFYLQGTDQELMPDRVVRFQTFEAVVTVQPPSIIGYACVESDPDPAVITITLEDNEVFFYYAPRDDILVSFDKNDDDGGPTAATDPVPDSMLVTFNTEYGPLASVSRPGYRFVGWFSVQGGSVVIVSAPLLTAAAADTAPDAATPAAAPEPAPAPTAALDIMATAVTLGSEITATTIVSTAYDHTLYAKWEPLTGIRVTFDPNGGVAPALGAKFVTFNEAYGELATTSREGYTFAGWFTSATGGQQVFPTTIVTTPTDHTLYAQWTPNNQLLIYDGNGATGGYMANELHPTGEAFYLTPNAYSRIGYTFRGWGAVLPNGIFTYGNGSLFVMPFETTVLYAVWQANPIVITLITYSVTFAPGTAGTFAPQTTSGLPYGAYTPFAPRPTGLDGWEFTGWSPALEPTVTGNVTYTAQWQRVEEDTVTVRFEDYNGRLIKQEVIPRGGNATAPPDPRRTGWVFTGWDRPFTNVMEDITVTAMYEWDWVSPIVVASAPLPMAAGDGSWALVNLILTVLGVFAGIWFLISYFFGSKDEDRDKDSEEHESRRRRRLTFRILNAIVAMIAVVLFLLTQDLSLPMAYVDNWTILHVIIAVLQLVLIALAVTWRRQQSEQRGATA